MTVEVLKTRKQIEIARREMESLGIDCVDHGIIRYLKRCHFLKGAMLGDLVKSWDVLKTVTLLNESTSRFDAVLDMGAYASEVLPALYRLGFKNLSGIDLNPNLIEMPHGDEICYETGDLYQTSFSGGSFSGITAISVIEHGFDQERLLKEVSRLLRPGGLFIASMDYWPDKIDTQGITAFGLSWIIFSRGDLESLIERARDYDLEPCGKLDFQVEQPTVNWLGKAYTFAWMVLKKRERVSS